HPLLPESSFSLISPRFILTWAAWQADFPSFLPSIASRQTPLPYTALGSCRALQPEGAHREQFEIERVGFQDNQVWEKPSPNGYANRIPTESPNCRASGRKISSDSECVGGLLRVRVQFRLDTARHPGSCWTDGRGRGSEHEFAVL